MVLQIMSSLREDSWILISAAAFNLLLWLMFMKKMHLTQISNWKRQEYFNSPSIQWWLFIFYSMQNATNGNSWKLAAIWNLKLYQWTSWLIKIHWSILHSEWLSYPHMICNIMHWSSRKILVQWVIQTFPGLTHFL